MSPGPQRLRFSTKNVPKWRVVRNPRAILTRLRPNPHPGRRAGPEFCLVFQTQWCCPQMWRLLREQRTSREDHNRCRKNTSLRLYLSGIWSAMQSTSSATCKSIRTVCPVQFTCGSYRQFRLTRTPRLSRPMTTGLTERYGCRCCRVDWPQTAGVPSSTCWSIWEPRDGTIAKLHWHNRWSAPRRTNSQCAGGTTGQMWHHEHRVLVRVAERIRSHPRSRASGDPSEP